MIATISKKSSPSPQVNATYDDDNNDKRAGKSANILTFPFQTGFYA
jgi:hypothetical protein